MGPSSTTTAWRTPSRTPRPSQWYVYLLSQACRCVCVCSLPPLLPLVPGSRSYATTNIHAQPQLHGIYATLFPLAQPTVLTTKLEHCKSNNKTLLHRLRATEQVLAQCDHEATTFLSSCRIDSFTAIDHCYRTNAQASLLAREEASALLDTVSAALNHTLLVLDHTEHACKTNELAAKLTSTRHKIEAGKRREEAGKEREQHLKNSIDVCGRQLLQQTQETTEAKAQVAAAKETVRQGTCSAQFYEFVSGYRSNVGVWWEARQRGRNERRAPGKGTSRGRAHGGSEASRGGSQVLLVERLAWAVFAFVLVDHFWVYEG